MEVVEVEPAGDSSFEIRQSAVETGEFALISPDVQSAACQQSPPALSGKH